ncbi:hypothetical protein GP486_002068 [Trichoglossum hirsutum]|uniref:Glycoside hydrolase family 25 protein n=1 Tax=Trichoglossum hirsutum TaxID=265104 RepID=A0A9P8RS18_9PEZI|nr:hypothetical protein GP486_002068 [Trichoglossum hirsutum]
MLSKLLLFALAIPSISCFALPNGNAGLVSRDGEVADVVVRAPDDRGGPTPTPTSEGFDISQTQPPEFWTCAFKKGYRPIIEGYIQGCGVGGEVAKNFLPSYNAAKTAGYTSVDAYMFPCTGNQPSGLPACKDPKVQVNEFIKYIKDNKINVNHLWFDIEPTSGECNAWNLDKTTNLKLAWKFVDALKQSGYTWGIYANGNQWADMFPSRDSNVASDLPLMAVQWDGVAGVDKTTTFMGGWTKAAVKQYTGTTADKDCGGSLDHDSFRP